MRVDVGLISLAGFVRILVRRNIIKRTACSFTSYGCVVRMRGMPFKRDSVASRSGRSRDSDVFRVLIGEKR